MAKWAHDDLMDAATDQLVNNVTRMVACSAQPTTFTEANVTYALADVTLAGGDFTQDDGDTNGRKVTIGAKSGVTIDATGTATHVALLDVDDTKLWFVTTCTSTPLTSGNTVNFGTWDIEISDPA